MTTNYDYEADARDALTVAYTSLRNLNTLGPPEAWTAETEDLYNAIGALLWPNEPITVPKPQLSIVPSRMDSCC